MMDQYYGDLARYLASSHDMKLVPYDWRIDLLTTGRALARPFRLLQRPRAFSGVRGRFPPCTPRAKFINRPSRSAGVAQG